LLLLVAKMESVVSIPLAAVLDIASLLPSEEAEDSDEDEKETGR